MRIIKIWFLLQKLQEKCHEIEVENHDHAQTTGHNYRAFIPELTFLELLTLKDHNKKALYADYLSIAEKMDFITRKTKTSRCKVCNKEVKGEFIRLSTKGLEFLGIPDLIEFILLKYKLTWTFMVVPIIAFLLGRLVG